MAIAIDESTTLVKVLGWYDNEWGYSNRLSTSHESSAQHDRAVVIRGVPLLEDLGDVRARASSSGST